MSLDDAISYALDASRIHNLRLALTPLPFTALTIRPGQAYSTVSRTGFPAEPAASSRRRRQLLDVLCSRSDERRPNRRAVGVMDAELRARANDPSALLTVP
jgi:hypothetical protein